MQSDRNDHKQTKLTPRTRSSFSQEPVPLFLEDFSLGLAVPSDGLAVPSDDCCDHAVTDCGASQPAPFPVLCKEHPTTLLLPPFSSAGAAGARPHPSLSAPGQWERKAP